VNKFQNLCEIFSELPIIWASFSSTKYLKALGLRCLTLIQYLTFHTTLITCQILIVLYKGSLKKTQYKKEPGKDVSFAQLNCSSVFTSCVLSALCGERHKIIHGNIRSTPPNDSSSSYEILFNLKHVTRKHNGRQLNRLAESEQICTLQHIPSSFACYHYTHIPLFGISMPP
jgi:hypothetical protein